MGRALQLPWQVVSVLCPNLPSDGSTYPLPSSPSRCQPDRSILPLPLNYTGAGTRALPSAPGRPGQPGSVLPRRSAPRQHPGLMHHSFCYWRQWVLTGERKPEAWPADPQAGLSSCATAKQQIQSPSGEGSVVNIWQRAWTQWFKNLPEVGLRHPLFFFFSFLRQYGVFSCRYVHKAQMFQFPLKS